MAASGHRDGVAGAGISLRRIQAVAGTSVRLRDALLAQLTQTWDGPVRRLIEPDDVSGLLADLDTPSLFGPAELTLVRADAPWLRRHADALSVNPGAPMVAGALILVVPEFDQRTSFAKALVKAGALHLAEAPDAKNIATWLAGRIDEHPQGADDAQAIASVLVDHLGADADALLGAIELIAIHAGEGPLSRSGAEALISGSAQRPVWEMTGALFDGNARKAIELLHAGEGADPEPVVAALIADLRRQIACVETKDDQEAGRWLGTKGNLYYARKRAQELGRAALLRLFIGALQVQRQLRSTGTDRELAIELFVLHARRVLARPGR